MTQVQQPDVRRFRLPDVGEGLVEADIVAWRVAPGDAVDVNTVLVEIETAKSLVELPSPFAGVVTRLLAQEGQTVDVGDPIVEVDVSGTGTPGADTGPPEAATVTDPSGVAATGEAQDPTAATGPASTAGGDPAAAAGVGDGDGQDVEQPLTLVGYGPRAGSARRRPRRQAVPGPVAGQRDPAARVAAKPPVRRLAKDLGVDLAAVPATGLEGTVTRDDVLAFHRDATPAARPATGGQTRVPVTGVRRATARAMVASAFTAPHVTEFLTVDVTRSVRLLDRLGDDPAFDGVRLTPLALVARAVTLAAGRHPGINASWDEDAGEIVLHHDVNLGIAVSAPRGLLVPNVKAAQALPLRDLAVAVQALVEDARAGRSTPADLTGGTITITNVGVFGVDAGTPILNPGEAAILCLGAVNRRPWVHRGKVRPRWVTQLSLAFDHRLVDGDLGSRFLADVGRLLEHPATALAYV